MFEIYYCNMVRQNLGLPYLPQKWYGNCRACRAGGAAHEVHRATTRTCASQQKYLNNVVQRLETTETRFLRRISANIFKHNVACKRRKFHTLYTQLCYQNYETCYV